MTTELAPLLARLRAIDEAAMYDAPASTQATVSEAVAAIERLTRERDEAHTLLKMLLANDDEAAPNGVMDCFDSDGYPYQSAAMAGLIVHARMAVEPFDFTAARAALSADTDGGEG